jgi:hypothetical protein
VIVVGSRFKLYAQHKDLKLNRVGVYTSENSLQKLIYQLSKTASAYNLTISTAKGAGVAQAV